CTRSASGLVRLTPSSPPIVRALQLRMTLNGRVIHENAMSGAATQRLVASGCVMAHVFGTSSPNTTCRYEIVATATTDATPPRARKFRLAGNEANQSRKKVATV